MKSRKQCLLLTSILTILVNLPITSSRSSLLLDTIIQALPLNFDTGHWTLLQKSIGISAMHMQLFHNNKIIMFDRTDFGTSNVSLPPGKCRFNDEAIGKDCSAHSVLYDVDSNTYRPLMVHTDTFCSSGSIDADGTLIQTGERRTYPLTGSSVLLPIHLTGNSKLLPEAEVMICGGSVQGAYFKSKEKNFVTASRTCGRLKVTDKNPSWVMEQMPMPRLMPDMLLLPTGDVLIINGVKSGAAGWERGRDPVFTPLLYKPDGVMNQRFKTMSENKTPRMYHSTAVLVPDGRVLIGGSNPHVKYNFNVSMFPTDLSLEAFWPPYLSLIYQPTRPRDLSVEPSTNIVPYDQTFSVTFSVSNYNPGNGVLSVAIIQPPFVTHSFGMNQRMVVLEVLETSPVSSSAYKLSVRGPTNANIAPRGYYMLFVVNDGVPIFPREYFPIITKSEQKTFSHSDRGNETFERLATFGVLANFMVYLQTQFNMNLVAATNLINIWSGCTSFAPLFGAFISDAYIGRFRTIAYSSVASLLGMGLLTFTAWSPHLHPPHCTPEQLQLKQCMGPTPFQLGALIIALALLGIGNGGIRPCSIAFGVDQFDPTTEEGQKGINSFFNWYYVTFTIVLMMVLTVVVYIQSSVSWVLGFGIPAGLMLGSIVLFFIGTRVYIYVKPEGSVFTDMARVFVAATKKRKLKLPEIDSDSEGLYYDPPLTTTLFVSKLSLTNEFRVLNKAAVIMEGEISQEGHPNDKWKLCRIQQVEEAKCLLRVMPVWASGIICLLSILQQGTFTVAQAMKMNRHLGPKFEIPPGSMSIISMATIGVFVPFYDRVLVPMCRRVTHVEGGITLLQRMGIGIVFSILSMIVAGLVETERRVSANAHNLPGGASPMTVLWLAPQLVLMGFAEAFNIIGQIEFYNKQFPENMRSIANSLIPVTYGGTSYLSSAIVMTLQATTGKNGHPNWLTDNINAGRVDYFYYIIAALGIFNMAYFLAVACRYQYKAGTMLKDGKEAKTDTEMIVSGNKNVG